MTVNLADAPLIELEGIGRRVDTFAFELLDTDRSSKGYLKVAKDSVPTVDLDTSRSTPRTLSGITLQNPDGSVTDAQFVRLDDIDTHRSRVRVKATLQNGSSWPLGVFMFGTDNRNIASVGETWSPELFDESFLLSQDLDRTWSRPAGSSVLAMFSDIAGARLAALGIPTDYGVDDVAAATALTYKVGTSRNDALLALASLLGAMPPFFANAGAHTLKVAPTFSSPIDHVYDAGSRIEDPSITVTNSAYKAPNRYLVVGDGDLPVRGIYDLPASAPNSFAATGELVTAPVHTVSGVTDPVLANLIAYVDSLKDRTTYGTATFSGAFDPRHGAYDTVQLLGVPYLETGWSVECVSGGAHRHVLTRMWTP